MATSIRCCCIQLSVLLPLLTVDFAVDLFVDGGNLTEEEFLLAVWCDGCVDRRQCNVFSVSGTFVWGVKQKENSSAVIFNSTAKKFVDLFLYSRNAIW